MYLDDLHYYKTNLMCSSRSFSFLVYRKPLRESAFNMRRGGMKILKGGAPKMFRHPKGRL